MSTLRLTTISNQSGSASVPSDTVINGSAKAWVNFNGTGTVAIRASFNVSSITDNGTGDYTVNFTTAMPDANYGTQVTWGMTALTVTVILGSVSVVAAATGSRRFSLNNPSGAGTDMAEINVSIFR